MTLKRKSWLRYGMIAVCVSFAAHGAGHAQAIRVSKLALKPKYVCVLCSLTVSASPTGVTFALVQGSVANGSSAIAITTTMSGISAYNSISLFAYFSSSSAALTDGRTPANNIVSGSVSGLVSPGTTYLPFTSSGMLGTPGATLTIFSTSSMPSSGCPLLSTCRVDNLSLQINLSNQQQLPAGTYTGTLILQAEVL